MITTAVVGAGAAGAAGLAWSLFEAQWVERAERDVAVPGLPPELDGFRILHVSDFHLGKRSLNARAVEQAVAWAAEREPDLIAITGDLMSHARGEPALRRFVARLRAPHGVWATLGNHDVADTRDPFSSSVYVDDLSAEGASLLRDEARTVEIEGVRVQIAGVDPRTYAARRCRPEELADEAVRFRILLSHFPEVVDSLPDGTYDLVLAGHLHAGQLCLPYPGGKLRLSHVRGRYWEGLFRVRSTTLYVSRGLGTTFVPFRFMARPEATELVLRRV